MTSTTTPPTLHHLLLTTHSLPAPHNPHNTPEKLRCPGTYTTLPSALAAAHKALFDMGFERAFFATYDVLHPNIPVPAPQGHNPSAKAVHATARDGSVFQVHISSTANAQGWGADFEDGRVGRDVFLAVQTRVRAEEEGEGVREHVVLSAGGRWEEVADVARRVGLEMRGGGRFEVVDVLGEGEGEGGTESELGENVVVHAVGMEGENVVVSVVKVVGLEAVRVGEASMRIR